VKTLLKQLVFFGATVAIAPALASYVIRSALFDRDRALQGSSQALSLVPGILGQYLRRAFYCRVLDECQQSATIEFGTLFSRTGARLGEHVYVGPHCHLGLVHLERDVLLASGVHVPSGPETHGTASVDRPIREQPGRLRMIRIGAGSWIGSGAVVMADVGCDSVVAAGAVVTEPLPDLVIAAGVPARVVRRRGTGDQAGA
jgi:acetyltransferase-like isoleucine patch superfamily enzyme